ncbi:SMI1/KNR4 family protein [Phocaeicola sartorii]|uniref:SMI1/KNR4 family protein n=1 Tax=Phocaeicola sartorii TaxID=671267 RepID=UPI00255826A4|nr:SMI1/KNR4 family protein [Phocaeicola sartorii]
MIEALKNIGFIVQERLERKELSSDFLNRYSNLPADYLEFLQRFQIIANESDNVWFNSIEDFNGESDSSFRWNEFERMSLEAFTDDADESARIRKFWDCHIPIVMSVKGGYQYLCIDLSTENYGKVFYGVEPEFEDSVELVCNTFEELIRSLSSDNDERLNSFR